MPSQLAENSRFVSGYAFTARGKTPDSYQGMPSQLVENS
jgi:hypothetical protein